MPRPHIHLKKKKKKKKKGMLLSDPPFHSIHNKHTHTHITVRPRNQLHPPG